RLRRLLSGAVPVSPARHGGGILLQRREARRGFGAGLLRVVEGPARRGPPAGRHAAEPAVPAGNPARVLPAGNEGPALAGVTSMRVLVTGAAGYVGRRLTPRLETGHELRLGDVAGIPGDPRWVHLDVTRLEEATAAAQGVDAVIHLAVASGREGEH